jgi:hypothetical protein
VGFNGTFGLDFCNLRRERRSVEKLSSTQCKHMACEQEGYRTGSTKSSLHLGQ